VHALSAADRPSLIVGDLEAGPISDPLAVMSGRKPAESGLAAAPINSSEFAALMASLGPFEKTPHLAIAVSGGPDSLALTLLADDWARRQGGCVVGLTVDHGLRPNSAQEADMVGHWLNARRIEHHVLRWLGAKPTTGIQRQARTARYDLLTEWCRDKRCLHLLTAHHRQDQAETVAMRQDRQSGDAGLAGMPIIRELRGLRLLRPLLGIDKARLVQTLRSEDQPWVNDPSNESLAFTRTQLRRRALDHGALTDLARRRGVERRNRDRALADDLLRHAVVDPAGFIRLDAEGFSKLPVDQAHDLLSRALMTIGGRTYPPRRDSLSRLCDAMRDSALSAGRTLAHCRIQRQGRHWLLVPEVRAAEDMPLEPGRWHRWDGRFDVLLRSSRPGLRLRALGQAGPGGHELSRQGRSMRPLPAIVRATLPSIWGQGRLIAVPHLGLFDCGIAPDDINLRFCPRTPLAKAPFAPHMTA
jgi:tRNA(Ile)-lysidine synthase